MIHVSSCPGRARCWPPPKQAATATFSGREMYLRAYAQGKDHSDDREMLTLVPPDHSGVPQMIYTPGTLAAPCTWRRPEIERSERLTESLVQNLEQYAIRQVIEAAKPLSWGSEETFARLSSDGEQCGPCTWSARTHSSTWRFVTGPRGLNPAQECTSARRWQERTLCGPRRGRQAHELLQLPLTLSVPTAQRRSRGSAESAIR